MHSFNDPLIVNRPLRANLLSASHDRFDNLLEDIPFEFIGFTLPYSVNIICMPMPIIRDYNFKISYNHIDYAQSATDISHPYISAALITYYKTINP